MDGIFGTHNLPEAAVLASLNAWLGELFDPNNIDRTVAALVTSQNETRGVSKGREAMKKRLVDAEAWLRRFQAAISAGIDPAALVEAINETQVQRAAAQAELEDAPVPNTLTEAEVYAIIDYLSDVGHALNKADPSRLHDLYETLRLELTYDAQIRPRARVARPGANLLIGNSGLCGQGVGEGVVAVVLVRWR
jgi:hypothetical protein